MSISGGLSWRMLASMLIVLGVDCLVVGLDRGDRVDRVPSPPRGPCIYSHRCPLVQVELGKLIWIQSEYYLSFPCRTLFILPYAELLLYPKVVSV